VNLPKSAAHRASAATGGRTLKSANFDFLAEHRPLLVAYAAMAERYLLDDPNTALIKLRQFAELLAECVADYCQVPISRGAELTDRLKDLKGLSIVPRPILDRFHRLRKAGNKAVHYGEGTLYEARSQLRNAYELAVWFHRSFSRDVSRDGPFEPSFTEPTISERTEPVDRLQQLEQELEAQRREHQRLEQELEQREAQVTEVRDKQGQMARERTLLTGELDQLRQQLADSKQDAMKKELEEKLVAKLKELQEFDKSFNENQAQLARYREQLGRADRESTEQANRLQQREQELEQQRKERQRLEVELARREAQVKELEARQGHMEEESRQLSGQLEQLRAKQEQLASDSGPSQATAREAVQRQVESKLQQLDHSRRELEENRRQLHDYREKLIGFQRKIEQDKAQLRGELEEQAKRVAELELANRQLRLLLHGRRDTDGSPWWKRPPWKERLRRLLGAAIVLILVGMVAGLYLVFRPPTTPPTPSQRDTMPSTEAGPKIEQPATARESSKEAPHPQPQVIAPAEATKHEGELCTVKFEIKSTYDGFDWGFLVNSEKDSRDPKNLCIVIERETAGRKYAEMGVKNLADYFRKGATIQATGKVEKYHDKRTGRDRYELRVKDPKSVSRVNDGVGK
jgi:hypothetical protein